MLIHSDQTCYSVSLKSDMSVGFNSNSVIQGGIYTLPSHLSPGARDLIPRMLVVDPMKRITIPEIRRHYWFKTRLPRYLAVQPPDPAQLMKKACLWLSICFGMLTRM